MEQTESFSFVNIRLSDFFIQKFPPSSKFLGDFSIVFVRISFDNFPPFQLGPDHKGVHRSFNMIDWMFFCLKKKSRKKYLLKCIHYKKCLAQQITSTSEGCVIYIFCYSTTRLQEHRCLRQDDSFCQNKRGKHYLWTTPF